MGEFRDEEMSMLPPPKTDRLSKDERKCASVCVCSGKGVDGVVVGVRTSVPAS